MALNHQHIERNPQGISKIKPYISQYNWNDVDFTAQQKDQKDREMSIDWKEFEQNNKKISLNILFVPHNTKTRLANQI